MNTSFLSRIDWDVGTAYDLFVSLVVLHDPGKYGLRPSWAAGVRSRMPASERRILGKAQSLIGAPVGWIHELPFPRNVASALWKLRQTPAEERLGALSRPPIVPAEAADIFRSVSESRSWSENDFEDLRIAYRESGREAPHPRALRNILDAWMRPEVFGDEYLAALELYYRVFFEEEEKHLEQVLNEELRKAQELARRLPLSDLLDELSQGVHLSELIETRVIVLVPSYWISPLVMMSRISTQRSLLLFGARPADTSLVPGELVPEMLLRRLKALADPTRLRILHYLMNEPHTPTQLARRLRLRTPTVMHHLNMLRLAGLVHVIPDKKEERRYAVHLNALENHYARLKEFLESKIEP